MESLTENVFCTLTYNNNNEFSENWSRCSKDFNRFIQTLRRLHNSPIQYLRSIESHKSHPHPHIHCVIRFPHPIRVQNSKYFDRELYKKWKQLWECGHSDFQNPRSRGHPILYIVKYISKESNTVRTLWKKYYTLYNVGSVKDQPTSLNTESTKKESPTTHSVSHVTLLCQKYKIKQCTWSSQFFSPTISIVSPSKRSSGRGTRTQCLIHKPYN